MFQNFRLNGNIYWALFLRLLLIMGLFTVCRIAFFLFNASFFPNMTLGNFLYLMLGGLRFDVAAVLYINMLFILLMILPFDFRFNRSYQRFLKYLFLTLNGIALAANVADFIYYQFTLRRTTADVFRQFENEQNMGWLWFQFLIDYWYALLFWILLMFGFIKVYNKIKLWGPKTKNRIVYYVSGALAIPLIVGLIVVGIRGGIRHSTRPITLSNAGEYVRDPKEISIVLNTPFAIIRTLNHAKVQKVDFYTPQVLDSIYSPVHIPIDTLGFQRQNVVVIILESFSKEFFGVFNRDKEDGSYTGYTPFLDSLIQYSKTYEYSFANGRKSIDGLPSVVSSIPSLGVPYFLSPYSGNTINSLASTLEEKGYHTSFFHGAPNGSMGFQAFMNIAGVDHYFGMTEYGNDDHFDGLWGIWDDKFLNYYANQLNQFPQPFMTTFFSVSSHHPFEIPEEFEDRFEEGSMPIHKCVRYTDFALKRFFEKASAMPWYDNTLFVITADHTSSNIQFPENKTAWGFYSIPIIFFKPDHSLLGREQEIAQQIDIMPSVLGYLHYDKPFIAFGRNLFREGDTPFAFNFKDNVYQLFIDDYLLMFDGARAVGLYNFKTDKMIEHNLLREKPDVVAAMEIKIKAIIQQYNNRMIEDRLTFNLPKTLGG
ncbi:MAG: LTA synthase family protein [Bacteroidota bacterium]